MEKNKVKTPETRQKLTGLSIFWNENFTEYGFKKIN